MKRILNILAIVGLFALASVCVSTLTAQSFSTANEVTPMPVADNQIRQFVAVATPTFSVGATVPVRISGLPSGAKGIYITAGAAALNYGPSTVDSTANAWPSIATTAVLNLQVSPLSPTTGVWLCSQSGTQTVRITAYK